MKQKIPCFLALDFEDENRAYQLANKLHSHILGFKVGPRLYFNSSPSLIQKLSQYGKIFLDFKFHDIPSTMEASVRASFDIGADFVTVHASSGVDALQSLAQVQKEYKDKTILAVSVLTSQNAKEEQVLHLAKQVYDAGLRGLVCSALEAPLLKKKFPDLFLVTPGIRLHNGNNNQDQKRIATPKQALEYGSDALVIGRLITESENPVQTVLTILESLKGLNEKI